MSKNAKSISEPYDTYIEKISLFLKNWRIGEGLSRKDYGALADLHRNSIYNIENNDIKSFNILTLLKCIKATGLSASQFFDSLNA